MIDSDIPHSFLAAGQSDVQDYLLKNEDEDERKLVLGHKTVCGIPSSMIAAQISGRRKAKFRLGTYYKKIGIVYPPSINLQQSSSEVTAGFKARLLSPLTGAVRGADLTGGFGVDSFFLSRVCTTLEFLEPDLGLLDIAKHNHRLLGATNIVYQPLSAEEFLQTATGRFDFFFVDPSRRSQSRKVFRFSQCQPDVTSLLRDMLSLADRVLIKASPLLDLRQAIVELKTVKAIWVVGVEQECREILFMCSRTGASDPPVTAVHFESFSSVEHTAEFRFTFAEEKMNNSIIHDPMTYLYEPHSWMLKTGAFKTIGVRYGLHKLHANTHLYTSDQLKREFPGRIFQIVSKKPDANELKKKLSGRAASVVVRNYPLTAESLRKKLKLKEGGNYYVIGFSGANEKFLVIASRVL